jgi:hypothetical protein
MNDEDIKPELTPGEKILWSGRPGTKAVFHLSDIIAIPFSFIFCGIVFFWEYTALRAYIGSRRPETLFLVLFGAIFAVAGLYYAFGRFFFVYYAKKRTWYALTGRRAIIITKIFRTNVRSIDLKTAGSITKRVNRDGTGTISFGSDKYRAQTQVNTYYDPVLRYNRFYYNNNIYTIRAPAFIDIENAEDVYTLIPGITEMKKNG